MDGKKPPFPIGKGGFSVLSGMIVSVAASAAAAASRAACTVITRLVALPHGAGGQSGGRKNKSKYNQGSHTEDLLI